MLPGSARPVPPTQCHSHTDKLLSDTAVSARGVATTKLGHNPNLCFCCFKHRVARSTALGTGKANKLLHLGWWRGRRCFLKVGKVRPLNPVQSAGPGPSVHVTGCAWYVRFPLMTIPCPIRSLTMYDQPTCLTLGGKWPAGTGGCMLQTLGLPLPRIPTNGPSIIM